METVFWLSWYVVKVWLFLVGTTVLRVMSLVMTPPTVSMPIDKAATSNSNTSFVCSTDMCRYTTLQQPVTVMETTMHTESA